MKKNKKLKVHSSDFSDIKETWWLANCLSKKVAIFDLLEITLKNKKSPKKTQIKWDWKRYTKLHKIQILHIYYTFLKNQFFKLKFQTAPDLLYIYLSNGQNFFFDDNGRLFNRFIITCYNTIAKLFWFLV